MNLHENDIVETIQFAQLTSAIYKFVNDDVNMNKLLTKMLRK